MEVSVRLCFSDISVPRRNENIPAFKKAQSPSRNYKLDVGMNDVYKLETSNYW